jgi:hypothetical protein
MKRGCLYTLIAACIVVAALIGLTAYQFRAWRALADEIAEYGGRAMDTADGASRLNGASGVVGIEVIEKQLTTEQLIGLIGIM